MKFLHWMRVGAVYGVLAMILPAMAAFVYAIIQWWAYVALILKIISATLVVITVFIWLQGLKQEASKWTGALERR